jgi:hypothetical protein
MRERDKKKVHKIIRGSGGEVFQVLQVSSRWECGIGNCSRCFLIQMYILWTNLLGTHEDALTTEVLFFFTKRCPN